MLHTLIDFIFLNLNKDVLLSDLTIFIFGFKLRYVVLLPKLLVGINLIVRLILPKVKEDRRAG